MNKLVWMGIAAIAAVLLLTWWFHSTAIVDYAAPPDRFKQIGNTTAIRTPQHIDNTTTSRTQTPQPPPTTAVVKPPFNASAYEVNYTLVFTISFSGITMTVEGWMVVGTGPAGNYSFGMLTVPLQGTATFKSATEGNTTYTMTCLHGDCTVNEEKWPFASLIEGVNITRTAKGQCRRLNYTGTLYEERGMLDPKAFSRFVEGLSGNYTAYVCEVNGVMLSADLTATASAHGEMMRITLKMEAVKAGPYSSETYRRILQEVKTNK
jgi:hypothetical protein